METMETSVFELLDFPEEILAKIFGNFNDIDLLIATKVCLHFEAIAKDIFAKRYEDDFYEIKVYSDDSEEDQRIYREFLEIFGNQMISLSLNAERESNQYNILNLISRYCRATKYLMIDNNGHEFDLTQMIQSMPNLTHLYLKNLSCTNFYWAEIHFPRLEKLVVNKLNCLNVEVLMRFMYINPQLNKFYLLNCSKFPLQAIQTLRHKLKRLDSLEYWAENNELKSECQDINLEQLNGLKITVDGTSFRNVLSAIARGSEMVKKLYVQWCGDEFDIDQQQPDEIISMFDKLTILQLNNFKLTISVIKNMVCHLPNLETLYFDDIKLDQIYPDDVLFLFRKCKLLKDLYFYSVDFCSKIECFNPDFHRKFTDVIKNRDCKVEFEFIQPGSKINVTNEKIIKNNELIYWTELETTNNHSKLRLLDLSDDNLEKMCTYLDEESVRALYETCTRTRALVQERIRKQLFTISDADIADDIFNRFGEHITKISIDVNKNDRVEMAKIWTLLNEKNSENIVELTIKNLRVDAIDMIRPTFPNLTILKVSSIVSSDVHIFPPMECPKLTQLEFDDDEFTPPVVGSQFGISLNHLSTIRINDFNDTIVTILHRLNDKVCDQIQEFTVEQVPTELLARRRLVNIAIKFRNLTTLNLFFSIEEMNTKYLFETCTKLTKLSLGYCFQLGNQGWSQMLQNIKNNCKQLEVMQIGGNFFGFENDVFTEIANTLPKVKLYIISYNSDLNLYRVEPFKKIKYLNRLS